LELATRLGDKYGRKGKLDVTLIERKRTHVWKPKLHEIAAGSMDIAAHEVDYLAQSYWHGFRYRIGDMTGIDRDRRQVQVAAYLDAGKPAVDQFDRRQFVLLNKPRRFGDRQEIGDHRSALRKFDDMRRLGGAE
jgi:NADH dehydrogenase FAD-containing subunit